MASQKRAFDAEKSHLGAEIERWMTTATLASQELARGTSRPGPQPAAGPEQGGEAVMEAETPRNREPEEEPTPIAKRNLVPLSPAGSPADTFRRFALRRNELEAMESVIEASLLALEDLADVQAETPQ